MPSIRRLTTAVISALALTTAATLAVAPAASAKTGPLSVQSVWVGDIHQNHRTAERRHVRRRNRLIRQRRHPA